MYNQPSSPQPVTVGALVRNTFRLYFKHFGLFVSIAAVVYLPLMLIEGRIASRIALFVLQSIAPLFVTAALTTATGHVVQGKPTTVGSAYSTALRRIGTLLVAALAVGVLTLIPFGVLFVLELIAPGGIGSVVFFLVFIPLCVTLFVRWAVYGPLIVLEKAGANQGLSRSWALTRGEFGHVFSFLFVLGAPLLVLTIALTIVGFVLGERIGLITSTLITVFTAPLYTIGIVLLYRNLCQKHDAPGQPGPPPGQFTPGA